MSGSRVRLPASALVGLLVVGCGMAEPVRTGGPVAVASAPTATAGHSSPARPSLPTLGGTWTRGPAMPTQRGEVAAAVLDGRLYVAGGFGLPMRSQSAAFEAYDPGSDGWRELAPLPEARDHSALTAIGARLYLSGGNAEGFVRRANLWVYDPATDHWSAAAPMPEPRAAHAAVAVGGRLYVLGGVIPSQTQRAPTWRYDPASGEWDRDLAPLPTYREHVAAVGLHDGTILVIGGRASTDLAAVEKYDTATDTWTSLPPLPTARGGLTAGLLDGQVHVVGGESIDSPGVFPQHEVLDLVTLTWAEAPPLDRGRHGLGSGVIDGRWYVAAGGPNPDLSVSDRLDIFTP